jgi:hypothetical protein
MGKPYFYYPKNSYKITERKTLFTANGGKSLARPPATKPIHQE